MPRFAKGEHLEYLRDSLYTPATAEVLSQRVADLCRIRKGEYWEPQAWRIASWVTEVNKDADIDFKVSPRPSVGGALFHLISDSTPQTRDDNIEIRNGLITGMKYLGTRTLTISNVLREYSETPLLPKRVERVYKRESKKLDILHEEMQEALETFSAVNF